MPVHLPSNFLMRVRQILLPLVENMDERDALLTDAFYLLPDSRLYYQIKQDGSAMNFTTLCIKTLIKYECLSEGIHALGHLLMATKIYCGVNKYAEIDNLVNIANALCIDTDSVELSAQVLESHSLAPVQTLATSRSERVPTVFISYSHHDTEFAQRLMSALSRAGHACWIDTSDIKGGDEWMMTIAEGINNSYAFVPIVTSKALQSRWVHNEILWAQQKNKLIIPVLLEDVLDETRFFPLVSLQRVTFSGRDETEAVTELLNYLPNPITAPYVETKETGGGTSVMDRPGDLPETGSASSTVPRKLELDYLERLQLEELLNTEKYTSLGGLSQGKQRTEIQTVFELLPMSKQNEEQQETKGFEDAVGEIRRLRQAVLLGEPGGGKTTTLWRLAADLVDEAMSDRAAPIPLLIRLGKWTKESQTLEAFIRSQIGGLGEYFETLLTQKRAALLLDGLNELPVGQRDSKYGQVQQFMQQQDELLIVLSCRELDYTLDANFNKITIMPLDPIRIHEFVNRYLGEDRGTDLFWRLAGQEAKNYYSDFKQKIDPKHQDKFWLADALPSDVIWKNNEWDDENKYWGDWLQIRDHASGLMMLARNPYMLLMLTSLYAETDELPANRGQLFRKFVMKLLKREHIDLDERELLMQGLARVAYVMQSQTTDDQDSALTVLPRAEVRAMLGEHGLYLAVVLVY